jgi:hypothetical protein
MKGSNVKKQLPVVAAMVLVGIAVAFIAPAVAVQYRFQPPLTQVAPGQQCTVDVIADVAGDSLGCVELWVTWDTDLVTFISGAEGTLFKNAGVSRAFFNHAIAPDTFSVEGCLLGYRTFALTPGQVARFVFRADHAGVCPLRIARFNLWDIDRDVFEPVHDPNGWIVIGTPTGVDDVPRGGLGLSAWPNPFNPSTTVEVRAPAGEAVRLDVYDAAGSLVRRLFDGVMAADAARIAWDGRNAGGARVPSGVYLVTAVRGELRATHKLVLIQ